MTVEQSLEILQEIATAQAAAATARETARKYMQLTVELQELLTLADAVIDAARLGGGPKMLEAIKAYDVARGK